MVYSLSHVQPMQPCGLQPARLLCPWDFLYYCITAKGGKKRQPARAGSMPPGLACFAISRLLSQRALPEMQFELRHMVALDLIIWPFLQIELGGGSLWQLYSPQCPLVYRSHLQSIIQPLTLEGLYLPGLTVQMLQGETTSMPRVTMLWGLSK